MDFKNRAIIPVVILLILLTLWILFTGRESTKEGKMLDPAAKIREKEPIIEGPAAEDVYKEEKTR